MPFISFKFGKFDVWKVLYLKSRVFENLILQNYKKIADSTVLIKF